MTHSNDLIELRHLMAVELDASLAFQKAKGGGFLDLKNSGISVQEIWQILSSSVPLLDLERAYENAKADRVIAQMALNGRFGYRGPDDGEN